VPDLNLPGWVLVVTGLVIGITSYALWFVVPIGEEYWHIGIAQTPAWIASFVWGTIAAERGRLDGIQPSMSRWLCLVAWFAVLAGCVLVGTASVVGMDLVKFTGGGTWQSFGTALIEGALVVAMSRAAFGAFVVHQIVLVGAVLLLRWSTSPLRRSGSLALSRLLYCCCRFRAPAACCDPWPCDAYAVPSTTGKKGRPMPPHRSLT
jgi:hypothetical protein